MASTTVSKLYAHVIDDVISNVREAFIDEGVDEQALAELKQVWEKKLFESKAVDREGDIPSKQPVQHTANVSSAGTITHQLAMPPSSLMPQTLLQYATGTNMDVQKTMQLNLNSKLTLTVPAHMAQSGLQTLVSAPAGTTAVQLPVDFAHHLFQSNVLGSIQHHAGPQPVHYQTLTSDQLKQFAITVPVTTQQQSQANMISQMDGPQDSSDDDDEDDFQDNDDDGDDNDEDQNDDDIGEEDEEPLNSDDDVSEDDPTDLFDTENVVVCQYDKITRSKNRWKFHLKDGIMNLQGKDFVFQKAMGDSEW